MHVLKYSRSLSGYLLLAKPFSLSSSFSYRLFLPLFPPLPVAINSPTPLPSLIFILFSFPVGATVDTISHKSLTATQSHCHSWGYHSFSWPSSGSQSDCFHHESYNECLSSTRNDLPGCGRDSHLSSWVNGGVGDTIRTGAFVFKEFEFSYCQPNFPKTKGTKQQQSFYYYYLSWF